MYFFFLKFTRALLADKYTFKIDSQSQHKSGFGWFGRGMSIKQGSDTNIFRCGFF